MTTFGEKFVVYIFSILQIYTFSINDCKFGCRQRINALATKQCHLLDQSDVFMVYLQLYLAVSPYLLVHDPFLSYLYLSC